jgi:hypothetical protein
MKKEKQIVEDPIIDGEIEEPKSKNEEALESLVAQSKDYKEKAEHFKTMYLKSQGAIEVLTQLQKEGEDK